MNLIRSLRLKKYPNIAFVGAGGKTSALFQAAEECKTALISTTTHMGSWQTSAATQHIIISDDFLPTAFKPANAISLLTGPLEQDRYQGISPSFLQRLREDKMLQDIPFLVEADGARGRCLKAPADHEPVIPEFMDAVVVVAGLSALGKRITEETVHRPNIYAQLSDTAIGEPISPEVIIKVLTHKDGGLKNIPTGTRRVVLLNQVDTPPLRAQADTMAKELLAYYDAVIVAALKPNGGNSNDLPCIYSTHEPIAGIILAAGGAKRFNNQPKQLLKYKEVPLILRSIQAALAAGLYPVIVVTGAFVDQVGPYLEQLPVTTIHNQEWEKGQSTSIRAGLEAISTIHPQPGAAIFLPADQPLVSPTFLQALVDVHKRDLAEVVVPEVFGQRTNPVLFDSELFPKLKNLQGDTGGRALFSTHHLTPLPWNDASLFLDIDTTEDLKKLP